MTAETPPPVPAPPPRSPPTTRGELAQLREPTWPTLIGILLIIVGTLGVLAKLASLASYLAPIAWHRYTPTESASGEFELATGNWKVAAVAVTVAAGVLAAALLVAGIGLAGRRRWAPSLANRWAIARAVLVPVETGVGYAIASQVMQAAANDPSAPAFVGPMMGGMAVFSAVFNLILGWSVPLFVFLWFRRRSVRADMAAWPDHAPARSNPGTA